MKTAQSLGLGRGLLASLLTAVLAATALMSQPLTAQAVSATDFKPGNIISDANFYDGAALTASGVQSFLNEKVSRCTIGDSGYAAGSIHGGNTIASKCLRNFTASTPSKASNAYCGAYSGAAIESAAQIIAKVGLACGISQKVLLVMLEKEQSLISDTWPYVRQFDAAMGYACPDSGPNNSANCDAAYYGFQNQVYRAAWQLKVYKANPASYNYRPNQTNTIQWHPNTGCGTSQVYIENAATAALYIYTPYRPNQAALNAGWGTGDGCSTYGNRNFFMFYSTWFGSPQASGHPQVDAKYTQNTWLGAATSNYVTHAANGGGVVRAYQNGAITWQNGSALAFVISGDFRDYFGTQGGLESSLGWPNSDVADRGSGRTQSFQGAAVSNTPASGFVTLSGKIRTHYGSHGLAYNGPLGWPVSNAICASEQSCSQQFENGSISLKNETLSIHIPEIDTLAQADFASLGAVASTARAQTVNSGGFVQGHKNGAIAWSKTSGAYPIVQPIRAAFGSVGGVAGYLGWPTGAATCGNTGSCSQTFTGGILSVNASGVASTMEQRVATAYQLLKDSGTDLGASLGNTNTIASGAGGLAHAFELGAIAVSDRTGAFSLSGNIRATFNSVGGLGGTLGWPTGNSRVESANGGGLVQGFENGAIASSDSGTYALTGAVRSKFNEKGGVAGNLGWPVSAVNPHTIRGGGTVQAFQFGAITLQSDSSVPVVLDGDIRQVFGDAGGISGTPGWPLSNTREELANGGGTVQGFQNVAIASSNSGTFMLSGDLRNFYNAQGGLTGSLGWPTSAQICAPSSCTQSFQGGTVSGSAKSSWTITR